MKRYYTRACNFYYGNFSKELVKKKKSISLHQIKEISFDHIEIITRKSKKKIPIDKIKNLSKNLRTRVNSIKDMKSVIRKKINFLQRSTINKKLKYLGDKILNKNLYEIKKFI